MGSLPNVSILKGPLNHVEPNFIHRLFENIAEEKFRNETAIIYEVGDKSTTHTYKSLNNLANKLARKLLSVVVESALPTNKDGDYIIAVSMLPTDKLVIALLAILKTGASYLPIDPSFPVNRIEHILKEAQPVLVLHDNEFICADQVLSKNFDELLKDSENFAEENIKDDESLKHAKDNLAIVLYTSGSTGVPKGVRLPHKVILNRLSWQFTTFPYSSSEKFCVFKTALTFVDSVSEIWGPLLSGRCVVVVSKKITQDPEKLVGVLERYEVERLVLVPSLLRSMILYMNLQKETQKLAHLKTWICSGEPLAVSLADEFFRYFPANEHILCNFYGSTEIMGDVTYHVISGPEQLKNMEKVPIGVPLDNTIIYLLDEALRPVDTGAVGELYVAGLNLAAGYVSGRDKERFVANPHSKKGSPFGELYRTGDFARVEKGRVVYEGRTDSQIKIRGHRVDLSEVEKTVNSLENIEKGVVLCYHAGEEDQALVAFVTVTDHAALNASQVENILQKKLAEYMVPQVIIMDQIPLLVNGKVDRQSLLKSYENTNNNDDSIVQFDIDYTGVPEHQLAAAKVLLETVATVLNRSARGVVNIDANFYEIGGNSLNSIYTIFKMKEQGYYICIGDFIGAQDLREILNHMSPDKIILPTKYLETTKYTYEMLEDQHKDDVFHMITESFYEKADLEQWMMPDIYKTDYADILEKMWHSLIAQDLSFVVKTENGKTVGVALNMDARDEPEIEIDSKLILIFEFLEHYEAPIRETQLPKGKGQIFHCNMMATNPSLTTKENIFAMQYMEEQVLRIARTKGFKGIFTTNTSPLTQQLGISVYGYQTMYDIQVNKYVSPDGLKPFGRAPDSQRALVAWKPI